jgi:Domain of unknown function (DUF4287)
MSLRRAIGIKSMDQTPKGPAYYFPSIEKKHGRSISDWTALIRGSGLVKHRELVTWLKDEHGVGHGHATALVAHTLKGGDEFPSQPQ